MREDRLNWADHHMLLALVTAQRSADPNTQVGACIVSEKNRVLGVGYNGPPKGICPSQIPWARKDKDPAQTKYPYIVHAEKNAIYNAYECVDEATLYVTMFPCNECAKDIIQAGIKEIIYLTNPYVDKWSTQVASSMLQMVDIKCRQHKFDEVLTSPCLQNIILSIYKE